MRIVVLGIDGYLGWPLALHLKARGHHVEGIDNGFRRMSARNSLTPILQSVERADFIPIHHFDLTTSYIQLVNIFRDADCIVHLAEQPSAPYSMQGYNYASETVRNNVLGTMNVLFAMHEACPNAHLLKLGSMGEYGTPDCPIPEGDFEFTYKGHTTKGLFPRDPGSWYHLSKVQDTYAVRFACKLWGLRATDVMQGVVFGLFIKGMEKNNPLHLTRLDYDQHFGTVINRFCVSALAGLAPTVYGAGKHRRSFLPLKDSIKCMRLAIENPPQQGEYRTFNQFATELSILQLADVVTYLTGVRWESIPNPRVEAAEHFYKPEHNGLQKLGYVPSTNVLSEVSSFLLDIEPYIERTNLNVIRPTTKWRPKNERPIQTPRFRRCHFGASDEDKRTNAVGHEESGPSGCDCGLDNDLGKGGCSCGSGPA